MSSAASGVQTRTVQRAMPMSVSVSEAMAVGGVKKRGRPP